MANKFQKSVQERLLQESKQQLQKKAVKLTPHTDEPEPEFAEAHSQNIQDISFFLQPDNSRVAKNKTFYLDAEVIDALHVAAKESHVTDSRLCNDILRKVLGLIK